jgi:ribosomal protein L11 methylase PrmA
MSNDPFMDFKRKQRESWTTFTPTATFTTPVAAHLVRFAGIRSGESVLDVGTGTGVVAVTAARTGARVSALDLTPELLVEARENGRIAGYPEIACQEGDAETLPYLGNGAEGDRTLDLRIANATLSQLSYRPIETTARTTRGHRGSGAQF